MNVKKTTLWDHAKAFTTLSNTLQQHLVVMKSRRGFGDRASPAISDTLKRRLIALWKIGKGSYTNLDK